VLRAAAPVSARRWLGAAIVAGGALAAGHASWRGLATLDPRVAQALLGGLLAAAATAAGALPALFAQRASARARDAMMGFGAGVMLAAAAFSLIVPALAAVRSQGGGPWQAAVTVGVGLLLGAALLMALDRSLRQEHVVDGPEAALAAARRLRRTWLFVFAIALHNVPEGLAIGVAYAGTDPLSASALATGIAIQDVPEGLVIALALVGAGYARGLSVLLGAASGLVEPAAAVLGAAVMTLSAGLLPWGLAFAAGAMLFVISHEIIPESHRAGHEHHATGGLMVGFVLMMVLDTALG